MAYKIKVAGKVQGVFFRASTKDVARQFGVKGWVKNESDGTVLIWAEGDERALNKFVEWVRQGPTYARVDNVSTKEETDAHHSDFEVRFG